MYGNFVKFIRNIKFQTTTPSKHFAIIDIKTLFHTQYASEFTINLNSHYHIIIGSQKIINIMTTHFTFPGVA
jgi:hypothetical protein